VDFFVVPTVLFKVLFVFVVLAHDRRRVHINVTDAPTAQWTARQSENTERPERWTPRAPSTLLAGRAPRPGGWTWRSVRRECRAVTPLSSGLRWWGKAEDQPFLVDIPMYLGRD
jgi:hypothetical protein